MEKSSLEVREFVDANGTSLFGKWVNGLNARAAAKVVAGLARIESGNFSNTKSVSGGVHEIRIGFGPGYRVYFGKDGEKIIILLGGGTKKKQSVDIKKAHELWKDYKRRKNKDKKYGINKRF